jgi:PilZ domain
MFLRRGKGEIMASYDWEWPVVPNLQKHSERVTMIRPIQYEMTSPIDPELFEEQFMSRRGKALAINVSSGGMLLLMDHAPDVMQVLKVHVPMTIHLTQIPTLAEVAWTRPVPMGPNDLHFVGLKFVL